MNYPWLNKVLFIHSHTETFSELHPPSETQGQLVGAGKSIRTGEKIIPAKKNQKREEPLVPWGQVFKGPAPNSLGSSRF